MRTPAMTRSLYIILTAVLGIAAVSGMQSMLTDPQRVDDAAALIRPLEPRLSRTGRAKLAQVLTELEALKRYVGGDSSGQSVPPSPESIPSAGSYPEYEALCRRPGSLCYALRDSAQIDKYKFGRYAVRVTYDAAADAAKWTWGTGDLNAEQIRLPFNLARPATGTSKVLIISDHYWDEEWMKQWWETSSKRLEGWKWLQVTDNITPGESRQHIWFEPQMRWIGWDAGVLSYFGARGYNSVRAPTVKGGAGVVRCGKNFLGDSIGPMLNCFKAKPGTWTRAFVEVEQRAGDDYARLSYWLADEHHDATPILLNAEMRSGGLNRQFWIEYNTSRETRVGGPMTAYARNVAVLKDLADPTTVFMRPKPGVRAAR